MKKKERQQNKPDFINGLGDSGRATMDLAVEAINGDPLLFREVMELSFTQPYPINMRTARVAQLCCEQDPGLIQPWMDEVIQKISIATTDGVKRSYLKVINDYTGIDGIADPGLLVQTCFDWLISPREAIAIRYHALGILMKTCKKIPELTPELISVLHFILEEGTTSPGLKNYINKSLRSLQKSAYGFPANK